MYVCMYVCMYVRLELGKSFIELLRQELDKRDKFFWGACSRLVTLCCDISMLINTVISVLKPVVILS